MAHELTTTSHVVPVSGGNCRLTIPADKVVELEVIDIWMFKCGK